MEAPSTQSATAPTSAPPPPSALAPTPRRMPEPVDDAAQRSVLSAALRRFHATGQGGAALPPPGAVTPAVLASVAEQLADAPEWPILLTVRGDVLVARPVREVLTTALVATQKAGRATPVLDRCSAQFSAEALRLVRDGQSPPALGSALEQAKGALLTRLSLSEADARALGGDVKAVIARLPAGLVLELSPETPVRLAMHVFRHAREALRAPFLRRLEGLRERLRELLWLDDLAVSGRSEGTLVQALGPAASLLNSAAFARAVGEQRGSDPMPAERRARISELLLALESAWPGPLRLQVVSDVQPPGLAPDGTQFRQDSDPVNSAARVFDATAEQTAELFRLARRAALEVDGKYQPATHDPALTELDWHGFTAEEMGFLPPVVAVVSAARLRGTDAVAWSRLQRSGRPVMVLALDSQGEGDLGELAFFHASLGLEAVAHRETYVVQAGLARPGALTTNLARMAGVLRPSLAAVAVVGATPLRLLQAEAALLGRVHPEFRFDPDAGADWSQRFQLGEAQLASESWPLRKVSYQGGAGELSLDVALTFADAMALEPAYRQHLRLAPRAAWSDELVPLTEWLEHLDAPESLRASTTGAQRAKALPFIWVVDDSGRLQRAVVTRAFALATRDRQRAWRMCQELAGFQAVQRAVADVKARVEAEARARVAALETAHRAELEEVRRLGARESMVRLAAALTDLTPPKDLGTGQVSGKPAPAKVAPEKARPASAAAGAAKAAPPPVTEEPWIESALCTTCNDCIKVNALMFVYNAEKQATIGDLSKGTYAEMVKAAEKCPAKCIHPGKPRPGDASATADVVARGARLN